MRGETEEMLTKLRLNFKKTLNVPKRRVLKNGLNLLVRLFLVWQRLLPVATWVYLR